MAYAYSQIITIDHTKCGTADSTNFPLLFYGTYAALADTGHGGNIQNTVTFNGQTVPADLIFTSDAAGTVILPYEVAQWTNTSGQIEVWIQIATLSHTVDTVIYMFAGNAAISTYQGGAVGAAWDSTFLQVHHLPNGSSLTLKDSTANGLNGTNNGSVAAATGQIDGAASFSGSNDILIGQATANTSVWTLSCWIKLTSANTNAGIMYARGGTYNLGMNFAGSTGHLGYTLNNDSTTYNWDSGLNIPTSGAWAYLVISVNGAATTAYVCTGGSISSANNTNSVDGVILGSGNTNPFYYGQDSFGSRFITGLLDECRVAVGTARNLSWVTAEYNNQNSPSTFYTLSSSGNIAAVIAGLSSVTVALTGAGALASSISGVGSVVSALKGAGALASVIAGNSLVTAALTGVGSLAGVINGTAVVTGALTGAGSLAAIINGKGVVVGALTGTGSLAGMITGTSLVTGALTGQGSVAAIISGNGTVSGLLTGMGAVAVIINGSSVVVAALTSAGSITSVIHGSSLVTGLLTGTGQISANINGTSVVTAVITGGSGAISAVILGSSSVTATVTNGVNYIVTSWMLSLPFTVAIDMVNNVSFPMPYRVGAASVVKLIQQLTLTRYGGSIYIGTAWMLGMISRQMVQTPGFAEIYNSAPIITGNEISA